MKILVTGACGLVGRETLRELSRAGHAVLAFDLETPANRRVFRRVLASLLPKERNQIKILWGNLTNVQSITEACRDVDTVIHLGAVIPPAADRAPLAAYYVNVAATELLVRALERTNPQAGLIFTSSISVYGDRRENPEIKLGDPLIPNDHDWYGRQKVLAEGIVNNSSLAWCILRLTYIVSPDKLRMDPLMFAMPLDTSIEICHARDVAVALRQAAEGLSHGRLAGATFQIAGGSACRTSYREYLVAMLGLFGLGLRSPLPEALWSRQPFHCGFMDTTVSQAELHYQSITLADYYAEVKGVSRVTRLLIGLIRPLAWAWICARSPNGPGKVRKTLARFDRLAELMTGMGQFIAAEKLLLVGKVLPGSIR